jgi:hypothetical protein
VASTAYNDALAVLLDEVVSSGPRAIYDLGQIRTNEIAFSESASGTDDWEMREFRWSGTGLAPAPVGQTPDKATWNETNPLADWVNTNEAAILARNYTVPLALSTGAAFRAGSAHAVDTDRWKGPDTHPVTSAEARHLFALGTCNGCHTKETSADFVHVNPLNGHLSSFFTGVTVTDPVNTSLSHTFNEHQRRQEALARLANLSCVYALHYQPLNMTH